MELHYVKIDKDWDDLAGNDSVTFVLPEESVRYSIYKYTRGNCILTGIECYNDKIFRILDIKGCDFVRNIVGYSCDGLFPKVKSLKDLKKVIKALDDECVKKFGMPMEVCSANLTNETSIGTVKIPQKHLISDCIVDSIALVCSHQKNYNIFCDGTEEKPKEELNLFPTKKHYQLNFNY